ncbi:serine/threonine protein kinase [Stieleria marina]
MSSPTANNSDGTPDSGKEDDLDPLDSIMADYLQRIEAGERPNVDAYLTAHPQYAKDLKTFFRNHHWLGDTPEAKASSLIGTQIGPYQIDCEIARGGMGVVYHARQQGLERPVALKLISSGLLAGEEERKRFRIEAEAAARLDHPGIIAIHEIGSWQGYEYFSMTLIEGPTLQKRVDDNQFDDAESARIVRDIARAVGYAHRAGIVHRDLKPDNILLSHGDHPLVTDFGLAKWHREGSMITRTGQVLGTPNYMSPEQACGRGDGDAGTDVYSLGAILYALLTGQPPHIGPSAAEVLRSVLQDEPESPRKIRREVPLDLENICLKAIRYEPHERYATADAFADDLNRFLAGEDTSAAASGLIDRVAREIRRDQHESVFGAWGQTIYALGGIIFFTHLIIFILDAMQLPRWAAYWTPRFTMLATIAILIYWVRGGSLRPRTVAERPVWSIWLGYLAALGVVNLLLVIGGIDRDALFPIAAALSGFGFIAMSGHVWGGSAIIGIAFLLVAVLSAFLMNVAPLLFGTMWLISLVTLGHHYRMR